MQSKSFEHPNTTVVTPETGHARDYTEGAAYGEYFASAETMFPTPRLGQNYAPKERIAVLRYAGESSSFPRAELEATGLVHVQLAGQRFVLLDQTPVVEAQLPAAWTEALLRSGATARRPSAEALRQAASTSEVPLPPLDLETLLSLPRPAHRSLLADPPKSSLIAEQARPAAAVAHLVADVRAFEAAEHRFTRDPATGELLDESETRWEITSDQLTAPDSQPLPRIPTFLTFGFASDAAGMGEPE